MSININFKNFIFPIFISISFALISKADYPPLKTTITKNNFSHLKGKNISLFVKKHKIGFLEYVKIPFFHWYVIHSFYIERKYRNKGYGKKLLKIALSKLKSIGATKIFIQPGPFEYVNGIFSPLEKEDKKLRLKKLIKFYQSEGFSLANSSFLSFTLKGLYKILDIDENPHYFMIKNT